MALPRFWDKQDEARTVIAEVNRLKNIFTPIVAFRKRLDDLQAMVDLILEGDEA